ncbi:MAG: transposase [Verrucomicrobiota bacterium]
MQWEYIRKYLPKHRVRKDGKGRPWSNPRDALNGIIWILKTGARWKDLPERYGAYQRVHGRFQNWGKPRVMQKV